MFKRAVSIFMSILMVWALLTPVSFAAEAASYADELKEKGFPDSYVSALVSLHSKYPKWKFEVLDTNLKWSTAVSGERSSHSKQMIEKASSLSSDYYCSDCNSSGSWVPASESAVKYYMDPRNWLSEKYIFQFEKNEYKSNQTKTGIEAILSPTWMKDSNISYVNTEGKTVTYKNSSDNTVKYSTAILDAAKNSKMSAYYIASKIVREVGASKPTAGGASGTKAPFIGMYNYYNIGAYSNASQGLQWASGYLRPNPTLTLYEKYDSANKTVSSKLGTYTYSSDSKWYASYIGTYGDYYKVKMYKESSSGTSFTTDSKTGYALKSELKTTFFNNGRPWTDPYKTIYYGAKYIASSYLNYQYTSYLLKFNVNSASGSLYSHEYTTDVQAPMRESQTTFNAYSKAGVLSDEKTFVIPVYDSMPSSKCTVQASSSESTTAEDTSDMVTGLTLKSRTTESLTFTWNKFSGATKYYLYIKNETKGTNFNKTVTTNSATIKGLTPANEYKVKVKAYTSKGWTEYSKYNTKHALPDKVSGLKVTSKAASSISLKWTKKDGADGYYIYKYNPSDKKYTKVKTVKGNTPSAKVTSLKGYTNYHFAISAYTTDSTTKTGVKSSRVSARTKVASVTLKSLTAVGDAKIKASWSEASGSANGYQIYYAKDKKFKNKVAEKLITKKSTTSYTGKNFTKGKTYYIKVRAYKTVSGKKVYGSWSGAKSIKVK